MKSKIRITTDENLDIQKEKHKISVTKICLQSFFVQVDPLKFY